MRRETFQRINKEPGRSVGDRVAAHWLSATPYIDAAIMGMALSRGERAARKHVRRVVEDALEIEFNGR